MAPALVEPKASSVLHPPTYSDTGGIEGLRRMWPVMAHTETPGCDDRTPASLKIYDTTTIPGLELLYVV